MLAVHKKGKIRFFLAVTFCALLFLASLNYSGMCTAEKRWLSNEERIDIAIQWLISAKKINASSPEEFRKNNPSCCSVEYFYNSTTEPFWSHVFGDVSVWYPVIRIRGSNGEIQDFSKGQEGWPWLLMDNCGKPVKDYNPF